MGEELTDFYNTIRKSEKRLIDIVSSNGKYHLHIPGSTRYFIPATKRELRRTSLKQLRFDNKEDREVSYLLLNSSYFYWWWRVFDGGMTVSLETILSLPIPNEITTSGERATALTKALEKSETSNLVAKNNAGRDNENVKHDKELIQQLNTFLYGEKIAGKLIKAHNNSLGI